MVTTDGRRLTRIDDPIVDGLQKGDPLFGWAGDPRLALYLDQQARMWELWRLEADNVYRRTLGIPCDVQRGPEAVATMIVKLVECDRNRGVDVGTTVEHMSLARAKDVEESLASFTEEYADRLKSALRKDGV